MHSVSLCREPFSNSEQLRERAPEGHFYQLLRVLLICDAAELQVQYEGGCVIFISTLEYTLAQPLLSSMRIDQEAHFGVYFVRLVSGRGVLLIWGWKEIQERWYTLWTNSHRPLGGEVEDNVSKAFGLPDVGSEKCCGWTLIGAWTTTFTDNSGSDPLSTAHTSYTRNYHTRNHSHFLNVSKGLHQSSSRLLSHLDFDTPLSFLLFISVAFSHLHRPGFPAHNQGEEHFGF